MFCCSGAAEFAHAHPLPVAREKRERERESTRERKRKLSLLSRSAAAFAALERRRPPLSLLSLFASPLAATELFDPCTRWLWRRPGSRDRARSTKREREARRNHRNLLFDADADDARRSIGARMSQLLRAFDLPSARLALSCFLSQATQEGPLFRCGAE